MKFYINSIHIIFFLLGTFCLNAQQYSFVCFSAEKGLAQSQVYSLAQCENNYLWIATLDGLSKFDGKEFTNFYIENGLHSNIIHAVHCNNPSLIWVGTQNGLNYIQHNKVNGFKLAQLNNKSIQSVYQHNNQLFVAFSENKLMWCSLQKNLTPIDSSVHFFELPKNIRIKEVKRILNRRMVLTNRGIYEQKGNKFDFFTALDTTLNYTQISIDEDKNIWASTLQNGVFKLTPNHQIKNFRASEKEGIISDYIRDLYVDNKNNIWTTSKTGISRITYQTNEITNFTNKNGFNHIAETILQDNEGNIWVGTEGKGIVKFVNEAFSFLTTKQGLHSDLILSFCQDNEGNIWFSSYGDGIAKKENCNFYSFNILNSSIPNNTIWCSLKTNDGSLWFGTADGLIKYSNNNFKVFTTKNGLPANKIQTLYEDNKGVLWIGTREGIAKYQDGKIIETFKIPKVRNICQTNNNTYWIASSNGLYKIKNQLLSAVNDSLLLHKTIYSLAAEGNNLWIGSTDGLYYLKNNSLRKIKLSRKKSNFASINFLFKDSYNCLWIGTNNGIYTLNLNEDNKPVTEYTVNDGLIGMETNLNAIFEDKQHNIWIGTSEGVSIFKRADLSVYKVNKPKVELTEVKLFYEDKNWLPEKQHSFRYNRNNFIFYFNAPYFKNPKKVKYSYILENFDTEWSPLDEAEFTRYANIPYGDYVFKVKSTVNEKIWSDPVSYSFTINPPFWLTWWFSIISLAVLMGLVYLIFKRQRIRQKQKRETEILQYKNKLIKLEQQSLNASMNRHFIFNALNSIQFYINKEDKLSANRYLSSFAKLIRRNLDSSVNEDNLISLNEEIERLDLYLSLEKMRFRKRFDYVIEIDKTINTEKTKVPGMFLQPFVENSIWHGVLPMEKKGKILIKISKQGAECIRFLITDNGIGIETSKRNKINETTKHNSMGTIITSNRIALLEKITGKEIQIIGPKEIIKNKKVAGTSVEIVFK